MKNSDSSSTEAIKNSHIQVKAASVPIMPKSVDTTLKPQISAPSYLNYLRENDAPPFRKPAREDVPKLLIGTVMSEQKAIEMFIAHDTDHEVGLKKFLTNFLIDKNIIEKHNLSEKSFLIGFLMETIDYAARRDFTAAKLACLITIYINSHLYFKWYYWLTPLQLWAYFKEIMIRHTIEDSPDGQEVFEPEESYDIMSHFHTVYVSNLPLVHILTFGAYRLKFLWPFKLK